MKALADLTCLLLGSSQGRDESPQGCHQHLQHTHRRRLAFVMACSWLKALMLWFYLKLGQLDSRLMTCYRQWDGDPQQQKKCKCNSFTGSRIRSAEQQPPHPDIACCSRCSIFWSYWLADACRILSVAILQCRSCVCSIEVRGFFSTWTAEQLKRGNVKVLHSGGLLVEQTCLAQTEVHSRWASGDRVSHSEASDGLWGLKFWLGQHEVNTFLDKHR